MGEAANDMIEGRCCSRCGVHFEEEHGYPVVCEDCSDEYATEQYLTAIKKEL